MPTDSPFAKQLNQLDQTINALGWLWRPQPYKEVRPAWCAVYPQLTDALLQLSEQDLES